MGEDFFWASRIEQWKRKAALSSGSDSLRETEKQYAMTVECVGCYGRGNITVLRKDL